MKIILTLVYYVDYVAFCRIGSFLLIAIEPNNSEKSYSGISKKHDQTCINLTVLTL